MNSVSSIVVSNGESAMMYKMNFANLLVTDFHSADNTVYGVGQQVLRSAERRCSCISSPTGVRQDVLLGSDQHAGCCRQLITVF